MTANRNGERANTKKRRTADTRPASIGTPACRVGWEPFPAPPTGSATVEVETEDHMPTAYVIRLSNGDVAPWKFWSMTSAILYAVAVLELSDFSIEVTR